jgi:dCTP deaminase
VADEEADEQEKEGAEPAPALNLKKSGFLTAKDIGTHWDRLFPENEDGEKVPMADRVNPASVDLRLGSEYFVTSADKPGQLSKESPFLTIPHGEFALLTTWEVVKVPVDVIALITMRYKYKRKGLINVSGFHVDPGFEGQILYSVHNAGPRDLKVQWKEPIFSIFFATLTDDTTPYQGEHKGQRGLPSEAVADLAGPPVNLVKLDRRLTELETYSKVIFTVGVALLSAIFGVLAAEALGLP